jgi:transposase
MKRRPRIYYTESQKALMWERWRKGESLQRIAELFDRNHSSIQRILAETGVFHPSNLKLSHGRYVMQTPSVLLNIGADVAKDEIVVACSEGSFPVRKIANQRAAVATFLKGLPAGSCIRMESTGIYHELLAEAAPKLGFVVFVLNPKDARHYAKGVGLRGKTDRVDAELIAHEHTKLHAWIPPTPEQRRWIAC